MIVLGNLPISRTDLEAPKNAIIDARSSWDPVPGLKRAIDVAKAHGSLVIGQLTHGGRQVSEEVNKASCYISSRPPEQGADELVSAEPGLCFRRPVPAHGRHDLRQAPPHDGPGD